MSDYVKFPWSYVLLSQEEATIVVALLKYRSQDIMHERIPHSVQLDIDVFDRTLADEHHRD